MDYSTLDDQSLIRLIAHTQPEALSELYDRYGRMVFSLAFYALGDGSLAEEVTQDVFLRIWQKADTYRSEQAKVSTWMTGIARNRSIDMLRQRGARPEGHSLGWDEGALNAQLNSDGWDADEWVEQEMRAQRVRVALASLPREQRQVLALAYYQGLSHSLIAEYLGEPLGTVKTRIRLGMQKLRRLLQGEYSLRK